MKEVRTRARELMKGFCRVCPVCDGKACAGEVPGMGGLGTGSSFKANVQSLAAIRFNMKVIHSVEAPDTSCDLLGHPLSLPVLAAPIGGVPFNMGEGITEEEYISSVLKGCRAKGTLGCMGDGVPDWIIGSGMKVLPEIGGNAIPFIKPWGEEELFAKLDRVQEAGADMVGMDLDACGLITLSLMGRPVSPRPAPRLKKIIERYPMKFILKGIMSPEQGLASVEAGASAIVVSNHGGRVLDFTPGVAEVLPSVAKAVKGHAFILADGGVRSGADVLKFLALGAEAVMIGRPFSVAAIGGRQEGVEKYLDQLKSELTSAMVLTSCPDLVWAGPHILYGGETA